MSKGIEVRHQRQCRSRKKGRCDCAPAYQANVWDGQAKQRHRRTFPERQAAEAWRRDAVLAIRRGRKVEGPSGERFEEVVKVWLDLARRGVIRTRSGEPYKPSAIRAYEANLRLRVLDTYGPEPVGDIRRADLQELVDELVADGLAAATVQGTVIPLKSTFRRELERGTVAVNPTVGLRLPAVRSRRDRIASPVEAAALLGAVPDEDRAIWATAIYAGLRRGEMLGLRDENVDLDAGLIHVHYGWDAVEGEIETKGRRRRRVPIAAALREFLAAQRLRTGHRGRALVFGLGPRAPFEPQKVTKRADATWRVAKLNRITLHECRHTFASVAIAAGVNAKALSTYMGHANIQTTFDLYGHLMPGSEAEAAGLLDTYLAKAVKGA